MAGALATAVTLGLMLGAALAPPAEHRVDQMTMTTACAGAEPIYVRPDGSYWVWRDGLRQVYFSTGESCRWATYPTPPPF